MIQPNLFISFLSFLNYLNYLNYLNWLPTFTYLECEKMAIRVHCRTRVSVLHRFGLVSLYYVLCFCVLYKTVLYCAVNGIYLAMPICCDIFSLFMCSGTDCRCLPTTVWLYILFLLPLPCCLLCLYGSGNALPLRVLRWLFVTIMN